MVKVGSHAVAGSTSWLRGAGGSGSASAWQRFREARTRQHFHRESRTARQGFGSPRGSGFSRRGSVRTRPRLNQQTVSFARFRAAGASVPRAQTDPVARILPPSEGCQAFPPRFLPSALDGRLPVPSARLVGLPAGSQGSPRRSGGGTSTFSPGQRPARGSRAPGPQSWAGERDGTASCTPLPGFSLRRPSSLAACGRAPFPGVVEETAGTLRRASRGR